MALLLERPDLRKLLFDIDTIRSELKGGGDTSGYLFSGLIFTLAGGGLIALGVPRLWASAVGGIIYGAFIGSILSILASLFGASVLYLAGKSILAAVVERRVGDKARMWKVRFQENAFWWVLYGRLFPFSNSTVMSLLCGSCKVPFIPFMIGLARRFCPAGSGFRDLRERWRKGKYLADRVCHDAPGTLHLSPKPFEKVVSCSEYSIDSPTVRKIHGLFDQLRADPLIRSDCLIH